MLALTINDIIDKIKHLKQLDNITHLSHMEYCSIANHPLILCVFNVYYLDKVQHLYKVHTHTSVIVDYFGVAA